MKRLIIIVLFSLSISNVYAEESPNYFVSLDLGAGMKRAWGIDAGYSILDLSDYFADTHIVTLNTGYGYVPKDELITPYSPRIPIYLRYILGGSVSCFELEFGAVIGGVNNRQIITPNDTQVKYKMIDYPVGVAWGLLAEPVYFRVGLGLVYSEVDHMYYSLALGVAI